MEFSLTAEDRMYFEEHGMLKLRNFYSLEDDIQPIQRAIHEVIDCVIKRHDLAIRRSPFDGQNFDSGFMDLVSIDRSLGGEVYDVVKMLPEFVRLFSSHKHQQLFEAIRSGALTGISLPSQGIRIDLPDEDRFRAFWHQEFLYQPQSSDGIVFWSPLVPITREIGPLDICPGSQREGLLRYQKEVKDPSLPEAFAFTVKDPDQVIEKYPKVSPLVDPGDLLIMDFLTLHQSGWNRSERARWSMQMRCFNFRDPRGAKFGWPTSITTGTDVEKLFPEIMEYREHHESLL